MIRKFLVCGKKQIFIQSKTTDAYAAIGKIVELLMPVNDFWEIEKQINKINYLNASDAPNVDVGGQYRKILSLSCHFAVLEADRRWLNEHKK